MRVHIHYSLVYREKRQATYGGVEKIYKSERPQHEVGAFADFVFQFGELLESDQTRVRNSLKVRSWLSLHVINEQKNTKESFTSRITHNLSPPTRFISPEGGCGWPAPPDGQILPMPKFSFTQWPCRWQRPDVSRFQKKRTRSIVDSFRCQLEQYTWCNYFVKYFLSTATDTL